MEINRKTKALPIILSIAAVVLMGILAGIGYGGHQTLQALASFKAGDLTLAAQQARNALPVAKTLDRLSLHTVPDLQVWVTTLEVVHQTPLVLTSWQTSLDINPADSALLSTYFQSLHQLGQRLPQTWLIHRLYPDQIETATKLLADVDVLYQTVLTGRHTFLLLFQNSDELRATGGFMGSYALVTLNNGQLENIDVQDIYVPDGQYTGHVNAPAGVLEYLSSGRGLRLPDANWWPDFPASAQQVLAYFALGRESGIEGVVAINLEVAESLLAITGDVFMPDYQMTITAENVAEALRSQREEFFPGSITKQHLLASFFNQVKFKMAHLNPDQQRKLFDVLSPSIDQKQIQIFANDERLQDLIIKYNAAGLMTSRIPRTDDSTHQFFYLVESNVGINKANRGITREVSIDLQEFTTNLAIVLTNANPATSAAQILRPDLSPHYVNYQRIYLPPDTNVTKIFVNQTPLTQWHEDNITTHTGEHVKQIGFLVTVPAQTSSTVNLELRHPSLGTAPTLVLQKQSGLPITHYRISYQGQSQDVWLNQDTWLTF